MAFLNISIFVLSKLFVKKNVFEKEPEVHPKLLTAPNTLLLPHIASATHKTREAIGMLAAKAIIGVLKNKPDREIPNLISR